MKMVKFFFHSAIKKMLFHSVNSSINKGNSFRVERGVSLAIGNYCKKLRKLGFCISILKIYLQICFAD